MYNLNVRRCVRLVGMCGFFIAATWPAVLQADDENVIDYRVHIMKTMGNVAAAIDQILQQKAPADNLSTLLEVLSITAATAKTAFEPNVPGGESKPVTWTQWPDFSKRLDGLTSATAELAKMASAGGVAAVAPKAKDALTCKSCHDIYQVENK